MKTPATHTPNVTAAITAEAVKAMNTSYSPIVNPTDRASIEVATP